MTKQSNEFRTVDFDGHYGWSAEVSQIDQCYCTGSSRKCEEHKFQARILNDKRETIELVVFGTREDASDFVVTHPHFK
jgi:hypothetical protein